MSQDNSYTSFIPRAGGNARGNIKSKQLLRVVIPLDESIYFSDSFEPLLHSQRAATPHYYLRPDETRRHFHFPTHAHKKIGGENVN